MSGRRLQRRRSAGWRAPEGAVYVGRPTRFGNWLVVGNPGRLDIAREASGCRVRYEIVLDRPVDAAEAARLYRAWLAGVDVGGLLAGLGLAGDAAALAADLLAAHRLDVLAALPQLAGRDLVCWCAPEAPCHADALLDAVAALPGAPGPAGSG